jgi:hypothetical protein
MKVSRRAWVIGSVLALIALLIVGVAIYAILRLNPTRAIDNQFGDQHLKTTVALVELHKLRFGRYPAKLSDLRYTGDWDAIALASVEYCAPGDGSRYFVKVRRGWIAAPELNMPEEFWRGTGFDSAIGGCNP